MLVGMSGSRSNSEFAGALARLVFATRRLFAPAGDDTLSSRSPGPIRPCGPLHATVANRGRRDSAFPLTREAPVSSCQLPVAVVTFVYELLDAHQDTARLVTESAPGEDWDAHLDYLRALQLLGRCSPTPIVRHTRLAADDATP